MSSYTPGHASLADSLAGLLRAAGGRGDGGLLLYRAIAEQLPRGAVFVVDRALRYVLAAGPALRMSGFGPADFEGRTLGEALPPELLAQYTQDYQGILDGAVLEREHCVGEVWYMSHGVPLADEQGCVHAALVVSYDITERRRNERRLQMLDRLWAMVRHAGEAGDVAAAASALLAEYFGGVRCTMVILDGELEEAELETIPLAAFGERALARLQRGDTVDSGDGPLAYGLPPWLRAFLLCPHVSSGRLAGLTAILSETPRAWHEEDTRLACDISERAWTQVDRLRLLDALEQADRRKDQFLAVLAHELRGPLTVVRNSLALLDRPGSTVMPQAILALVERQFGHINRLIEDVLDTSYVCHGRAPLQRHRIILQEAVLAAVEAARALVSARTHTLSLSMPPDAIPVYADPTRLAQAFGNVFANAIKYSRAPVKIGVQVERQDAQVLVRISDNGIGMSSRTLARLLDLFARSGSEAEAMPAGGLGVGLWITRQLVEAHGGSIRADSGGPDQGSTFTIVLPVHQVH